jgi:peptidoglycan lytic transglycosylase
VKRSGLTLAVLYAFLLGCGTALAQTSDSVPPPSTQSRSSALKTAKGTKKKKLKKKQAAASHRVRRLNRAFVASADLKPMAHQLLQDRSRAAYAGVEAYARKHAQEDAGALAWLAVGYARVLDQDFSKALEPLKRAQSRAGDLRDYVDYFLGASYGATGKPDSVIATLREFNARHPDSLVLRDAMLVYGTALMAAGRTTEAVPLLEKYRTPARPDFELALGRAYFKTGEYARAAEALRRVYYAYPLSAEAHEAQDELDRVAAQSPLAPPSFAERKARADLMAQGHRYSDAAREYRGLLTDVPAENRAAIDVALGVALHRSGNDRDARAILEVVPETADESNALRWVALAEIYRSAEDEQHFVQAVSRLRETGSTSENFEQALLLGGNMYLLRKDYDKAIDYFRELQQRFPHSRRASYAHWKATWLALRQGRRDEVKHELEEQLTLYPNSAEAPATLYWRARLAEEDGDIGRARAWYLKLTYHFHQYYYAELARARLQVLPATEATHDALLDALAEAAVPENAKLAPADPPEDSVRYQKSQLLQNGGMTELAIKELRAAAPEGTAWVVLKMARYYQENGLYHRALETLKRAVPSYYSLEIDSLPRPYWETLFPRPYWTELKRYSQQNELDPFLVASLIRQESEFNPGAVSRADALGLMQLLPNTGRKVAHELRVRRFSSDQLLTPNFNMQLGTKYFRNLVDYFGGRTEYALAAYNAGTDRVQGWLADGSYRSPDEFVESIPFTETREYVQAILRNTAIYKRLYGKP